MIEQTQVQTVSELRVESVSGISSVCEQVPTHWTIPILTVVAGLRFELGAIRRQSHLHELMSLYLDVAKENYELCMLGRLLMRFGGFGCSICLQIEFQPATGHDTYNLNNFDVRFRYIIDILNGR